MLRYIFPFSLLLLIGLAGCSPKTTTETKSESTKALKERKLIWSDEFNTGTQPDTVKWGYDVGGGGWGNNELQYYTDHRTKNARIEDGKLIIEAHQEELGERNYTSARLVTRGKQTFTNIKLEVRAKVPSGLGTWPAIWMLGDNLSAVGWPKCGEIDIMEHVGYSPDSIFGTLHCNAFNHTIGTQQMGSIRTPDVEGTFHIYGIDWQKDHIDFLFDGEVYHTVKKPANATIDEWPFDKPHYLLLNLAVGGNWGGKKGVADDIWPRQMEVDWVRVYE